MSYSSIQWIGVLICIVINFMSAFTWFGPKTFYPAWQRAMKNPEGVNPNEGQNMPIVFGLSLVGAIVQAVVLALIFDLLHRAMGHSVGLIVGLGTGLVIGIAAAATSLGHRLFAGHGFKVWIIEVGNDVLNFALMGAVLGLFY